MALIVAAMATMPDAARGQGAAWPQHSMDRPRPPAVRVGAIATVPPPSDAVVLFDGTSLASWRIADSTHAAGPAKWKVAHGYMEVVPHSGAIETKRGFGDAQLHVEWRAPSPPRGESQDRGNSGVFLMGRYEVQVLDSYKSITYADGQAGAVYGQFPPLVNASRPPGEWQAYDIVFHAPRFEPDGSVRSPARMTVFHNGVLVQDDVSLTGPTHHNERAPYSAHPDRLPLSLQDHDHPVRYRNIWIRELSDSGSR
jgi:hypothetical protein